MRKVVMILLAIGLSYLAQNATAALCPTYLYGQWNGVYYYYCLPQTGCVGPQSGQSATPKTCGSCSGSCDAIRLLSSGNEKEKESASLTRKSWKVGQLQRHVGKRTGNAGMGEGTGNEKIQNTFYVSHKDTSFIGGDASPTADRTVWVERDEGGSKKRYYFRVLELNVGGTEVLVGQQLERDTGGAVEFEFHDGDDNYDHQIKPKGGTKLFDVVSRDKIKK